MLKISESDKSGHSATLKLEGRIVGPWVGELRQVCQTLLSEGLALKLDLADVTFVDAEGIALLVNFQTRGMTLKNCSPFVGQQLRSNRPPGN